MKNIWRVISREGEGEMAEKIQGIISIVGRYRIERGALRTVQEMEKNLYA